MKVSVLILTVLAMPIISVLHDFLLSFRVFSAYRLSTAVLPERHTFIYFLCTEVYLGSFFKGRGEKSETLILK
jgi:hypothetical protein